MTQAILLIRGLPGSGKSTLARALAAATGAVHCEADDYFINDDGTYRFNREDLPLAHEACLAKFRIALDEGRSVIVANTFSRKWEMRAYHNEAAARGIPCLVVTATGTWPNVHGVPEAAVQRMRDRWEA